MHRRALALRVSIFSMLVPLGLIGIGCAGEVETGGGSTPGSTPGNGGGNAASSSAAGTGGDPGTGGQGSGGQPCVASDEVCDGVDNNCDAVVDEGCACVPGQQQPCYTGPESTEGIGDCLAGVQTCNAAGDAWGECADEVLPSEEKCDGLDNDCNGEADDDLGMATCGVGACLVSVPKCTDGKLTPCKALPPKQEVCDGIDNDCDQLTDENDPGLGKACATGSPGLCGTGKTACKEGAIVCTASVAPSSEKCDGLDNDCDGTPDNKIPGTGGSCTTGLPGVCSAGMTSCQNSTIDCFPTVAPSDEVCDGLDNDCDDVTDEDNPEGGGACATGQPGACSAGTVYCLQGALACVPNASGSAELCNGLDDDCDGQVDNGNPGAGGACGCGGTFACVDGALECQGGPTVYFEESFADNSKGWTVGTDWAIGPAAGSSGHSYGNPDPGQDHTATADNGIAGVILGGNAPVVSHGAYYLTSPTFNAAGAATLYLQFWRWLNSDYSPYMVNTVDVFNGVSWVNVWQSGTSPGVTDAAWVKQSYDITAHVNATMQVRFGFSVSSGAYTTSQWNVDDVLVTDSSCP